MLPANGKTAPGYKTTQKSLETYTSMGGLQSQILAKSQEEATSNLVVITNLNFVILVIDYRHKGYYLQEFVNTMKVMMLLSSVCKMALQVPFGSPRYSMHKLSDFQVS